MSENTIKIRECLQQFRLNLASWLQLLNSSQETKAEQSLQAVNTEHLHATAYNVSSYVTKFTLAFTGEEDEIKVEDCAPFAEMLQQAIWSLYSVVLSVMDCKEYSLTLKKQLRTTLATLLQSVIELIEAFEIKRGSEKVSAHLTGKVWKVCKEFEEELSLDNRKAVQFHLSTLTPLIRDATKEFEELYNEKSAPASEEPDSFYGSKEDKMEDDESEQDDMWSALDDEMTPEAVAVIPSCVTLFKCAFSLLKKLHEMLAVGNNSDNNNNNTSKHNELDYLEELSQRSSKLVELIDSVGAAIYECDADQIQSVTKTLFDQELSFFDIVDKENNRDDNLLPASTKELNNKFLNLLRSKANEGYNGVQAEFRDK